MLKECGALPAYIKLRAVIGRANGYQLKTCERMLENYARRFPEYEVEGLKQMMKNKRNAYND